MCFFWFDTVLCSQDFSSSHEDDLDESETEHDMQAIDTLSELSSRCPSSSKYVTPQCKKDRVLSMKSLQLDAWDKMQTPSPLPKPRRDHIMALAEALKNAKDAASNSKQPAAETQGQLPDYVARLWID